MDIEVKLESLDPTGIPFKTNTLKIQLEPINSRRSERLYLHIGECVYRVDRKGYIIERVIPNENNK